jgi:hypothetical protein
MNLHPRRIARFCVLETHFRLHCVVAQPERLRLLPGIGLPEVHEALPKGILMSPRGLVLGDDFPDVIGSE